METVKQPAYYWSYILNDETADIEADSKDEAQESADEEWADRCESDSGSGELPITLIRFFIKDDGEREIVERVESGVEYDARAKSMFDEHNTHHNSI